MVITSTTGNRVVAKSGSRVRISPTPPKTKPPNRVVFVFAMGEIRSPVVICRWHITSPVRRLVISSIFVPTEQRCNRISPTPPKTKPPNRVVFVFAMGEIRSPVVICRRHITSPVRRLVISSIFVPTEQRCKRISPTPPKNNRNLDTRLRLFSFCSIMQKKEGL